MAVKEMNRKNKIRVLKGNNMYKKILARTLSFTLALAMVISCGNFNKAEAITTLATTAATVTTAQTYATHFSSVVKAPTAKEVYTKMTKGIEGPPLMAMDATFFKDAYGIDKKYLESYVVMTPLMNVHATEYAVFKVKNTKDIAKVKAGIKKRLKFVDGVWKQYLPNQYDLVKANKVIVQGKYVLFVISADQAKIVKNFKAIAK